MYSSRIALKQKHLSKSAQLLHIPCTRCIFLRKTWTSEISLFSCPQVCGGNLPVWSCGSSESLGEEMCQILWRGSSEDQVLLQQGELLSVWEEGVFHCLLQVNDDKATWQPGCVLTHYTAHGWRGMACFLFLYSSGASLFFSTLNRDENMFHDSHGQLHL